MSFLAERLRAGNSWSFSSIFQRQKGGSVLVLVWWKLKNSLDCIYRYLRNSLALARVAGVRRIELSSIGGLVADSGLLAGPYSG